MKTVLVCWDTHSREERAQRLLEQVAPALLATEATGVSMLIAGPHARYPSPSPFPLRGRRPKALVNLWADESVTAKATVLLEDAGFEVAAYSVEESIYRDYGDNQHASARDWPDGSRSPGATLVSFLVRPAHLDQETWVDRWFSTISPVSEAIQPRTRYVRNVVRAQHAHGAPAWDGIVEEAFPSGDHIRIKRLFYGASSPFTLVRNMLAILQAVRQFTRFWEVTSVVMSEHFLRTPPASKTRSAEAFVE